MSIFGKLATYAAKRFFIPAVVAIAKNPKAPLTLDAAKDALVEAGKEEGLRVVVKRAGEI